MARQPKPFRRIVLWFAMTSLLLFGARSFAQQPAPIFSGPQPGERLPPLKILLAYGDQAGQTVDLVDRASGRPTLLVIVHGKSRPAARLMRVLMNFAEIHQQTLFGGVVYLDSDASAGLQELNRAVSWWRVAAPIGVSNSGAEGPGSYGFNRNVNLTVLVADQGRVVSNFALVQPSETDAPKILKPVVSLVEGRIPTAAEVLLLGAPTAKPPNVPWRNAPPDAKLRELICLALAAQNNDAARAAAAALDQYVRGHVDRQMDLGNAAAILLERRARAKVEELPIIGQIRRWRRLYASDADSRK